MAGCRRASLPGRRQLLITADCGGSNCSRRRLWKAELARLATEPGIQITVVRLPLGASKWNKIEHRLFSAISMDWRGRPLESHQVILETIRATTTRTGLRVHAELDTGSYPAGIKVTSKQMKNLAAQVITPHEFHPDWIPGAPPRRRIGVTRVLTVPEREAPAQPDPLIRQPSGTA